MSHLIKDLYDLIYSTSDLDALNCSIKERTDLLRKELESDEPVTFGIGQHFNNAGMLIRNAANRVMSNEQAN